MTGGRDFVMEWVTFVGGSIGLPDAYNAWNNCDDSHPLMWLLRIVAGGSLHNSGTCNPGW